MSVQGQSGQSECLIIIGGDLFVHSGLLVYALALAGYIISEIKKYA